MQKITPMEIRFKKELARQVGETLRKIRVSQPEKITQADIADFAEISIRYYTYLESGERLPSFEVMLKIAKAYDMCISDFCKHFDDINI